MNKWQALTNIAKAFIAGGNPGYAFATVLVFVIPTLAGVATLAVKLLH